MRVVVDQDACVCSGQCVLAAPDVFDQSDEGFVLLLDDDPPPELHEDVRQAAATCPSLAITVEASGATIGSG
jgi:ferredoxin